MLRIWFGSDDLGRVRVARRPHALWETVLSLQTLQGRRHTPLPGWRDVVLGRLGAPRASAALRTLRPLIPARGYFPDFLTPADGDLDGGIAAVRNAPPRRAAAELELLAGGSRAEDDDAHPVSRRLGHVGDALAYYHQTAVAPYMPRMRALIDADRAVRARALLDDGVEGLLRTLRPAVRWRRPVLEADYPVDQELRLDGRGLLLVPSVFCERTPVSLLDPSLPPTLVYPIGDGGPPATPAGDGLAALIGGTRGEVLRRLDEAAATTSELARVLGISTASASQHASVLRRSGLVVSRRAGNAVIHRITPLGAALLRGGEHGAP
ncbi:ArsR/SmtB family transcription factor [Actinoallomurus iriomotensis]|uniref:Transcriptional regulator n=1 Tax=Actinoallomurus iriomotensis TaxID=478107 RepID=A0A9W6RSB5_9ACTN|nr:winged helix-turn-helix domain-containing protein [Actinoallomurus iriomotensis]GLY80868.1 transcriptional regulator [Actinoallomurus iriomotensis]